LPIAATVKSDASALEFLKSPSSSSADVAFTRAIIENFAFGDGLLLGCRHFVQWFFAGRYVLWLHK
jgi:hypothetical protein